jgi:hypothetical protein
MKPLLGSWLHLPVGADGPSAIRCERCFTAFGKGWIELDARWAMGEGRTYRERAFFGAVADGSLGFVSFTNDGKRSEGRFVEAPDLPVGAVAFEAVMPAGLARMSYWAVEDSEGFHFAVESRTAKGWNRFVTHQYRPA